MNTVHMTKPVHPAETNSEPIQDMQISYRPGFGFNIEFWTQEHSSTTMVNLARFNRICSYLFHKHRSTLAKLEELQHDDYKRNPEKSFRVNEVVHKKLVPVLCLDRYPHQLSDEDISVFEDTLPSLSLQDSDIQDDLIDQLQIIRVDYARIAKQRSQWIPMARDANFILRVMIRYSTFSDKIESELEKQGLNTFELHGDISKGTLHCYNAEYNQALFDALRKHGFITPEFADRIPFQMTIGHFSEGATCSTR